jgi:hypothetical protein
MRIRGNMMRRRVNGTRKTFLVVFFVVYFPLRISLVWNFMVEINSESKNFDETVYINVSNFCSYFLVMINLSTFSLFEVSK